METSKDIITVTKHLQDWWKELDDQCWPPARTEELKVRGYTITLPFPSYWKLTGRDTDYKNAILKEFQDMLTKEGVPHDEQRFYAAQLAAENGAFTADRLGDHGCSFGLIQFNACAKKGMSARRFLQLHPEWLDYKTQLRWMVEEIKQRRTAFTSIRLRVLAHNSPACANAGCWDTRGNYFAHVSQKADLLVSSL